MGKKYCCHTEAECGCPEATSFKTCKSTPFREHPADMIVRIAQMASAGVRSFENSGRPRELREALNTLIDERVSARMAEKKEPEPTPDTRTTGQKVAEKLIRPLYADPMKGLAIHPTKGTVYATLVIRDKDCDSEVLVAMCREYIAAAIDKAIADDRAAMGEVIATSVKREREACARAARCADRTTLGGTQEFWRGVDAGIDRAVESINNRP